MVTTHGGPDGPARRTASSMPAITRAHAWARTAGSVSSRFPWHAIDGNSNPESSSARLISRTSVSVTVIGLRASVSPPTNSMAW